MVHNALKLWMAGSLMAGAALYASTEENMANSLMKLRAEVEQLDQQIQDEKDAVKGTMRSLTMEKNELEATVGRESLKIKQIEKDISVVKKVIAEAGKNTKGLRPIVSEAMAQLREQIAAEIPFKTVDRLADLDMIKSQFDQNITTPQKALALIWNSYADEIRMTKENGIFKQTIELDGQDLLVQVARIGTVMMFFKTPDDRVGYVEPNGDGWNYKEVTEKEPKEQVMALFDGFMKQIRTGYYTIPNALIMKETY